MYAIRRAAPIARSAVVRGLSDAAPAVGMTLNFSLPHKSLYFEKVHPIHLLNFFARADPVVDTIEKLPLQGGGGVGRAARPWLTCTFPCNSCTTTFARQPVDRVIIPGVDGEYGVTAGHTPIVSELKPGIVKIVHQAVRVPL